MTLLSADFVGGIMFRSQYVAGVSMPFKPDVNN